MPDDDIIWSPSSGVGSSGDASTVSSKTTTNNGSAGGRVNEDNSVAGQKKRRIPGACDICKRKKIRCDSGQTPDNRCSNCLQFGLDCTHKEVTKTLGSAKGYVESLEARLEKMDRIFSKLLPGVDLSKEMSASSEDSEFEALPRNDDEPAQERMEMLLNKLTLDPKHNRFFGKSSAYQLVQTALDLRQDYTGKPHPAISHYLMPRRRDEFWEVPQWKTSMPEPTPIYVYPPEDLMPSLISAYFENVNRFLPLLHQPLFEKSVSEGTHISDHQFGATLLLVCAHGAKYSSDYRVLSDGTDSLRSAGCRWYEQVNASRRSSHNMTTLYELQMHALHVLFSQSSEAPRGHWAQIGLAMRLCQEVGAHRRKKSKHALPSAEDELWKRAFWVILSIDRQISATSGRPSGLQDEDFDLDLPLECDDEYWGHGFQQPQDKPSSIVFFNCYLRLMDILACAMRFLYSIKQPSNSFNRDSLRTDQQLIVELDSMMNSWMDSVPNHLKWNQHQDNELFLRQSAALHATYYHLQIFIHRPFIPSPRNPATSAFPSLAICTNAARSCCHVLEAFTKVSAVPLTQLHVTAFTAALILLLNIWSGKRSGFAPNPRREMEDVQRCMQTLAVSEKHWASAGRFWDILTEIAFAGHVSIPDTVVTALPPSRKRTWDDDVDAIASQSPSISPTDHVQPLRGSAKSRRISITPAVRTLTQPSEIPIAQQPSLNFSLPMYSNELGRLPIYGQFNFLDYGTSTVRHTEGPDAASFGHNNGTMAMNVGSSVNQAAHDINLDQFVFSDFVTSGAMGNASLDRQSVFDGLVGLGGASTTTTSSESSNYHNSQVAPNTDFASLFTGTSFEWPNGSDEPEFGKTATMDNDTMTMWSTAPTSMEFDEWSSYISSMEQMTQSSQGKKPLE